MMDNNAMLWNANLTFVGSNPLNMGTGAVAISANHTITTTASTLTIGGVISGAFVLTKAGAARWCLRAQIRSQWIDLVDRCPGHQQWCITVIVPLLAMPPPGFAVSPVKLLAETTSVPSL